MCQANFVLGFCFPSLSFSSVEVCLYIVSTSGQGTFQPP